MDTVNPTGPTTSALAPGLEISTPLSTHAMSAQQVPTAVPAELLEQMHGCVKRLARLIDATLSEHGLSLSRAKILVALTKLGPSNQSTLAAMFDLAPRTVTELVDLLERDGLVERRTDPADRRARQVHLTDAGRAAHQKAMAARAAVISQIFGPLSEEQLLGLSTTLCQIDREVLKACGSGTPQPISNPAHQ